MSDAALFSPRAPVGGTMCAASPARNRLPVAHRFGDEAAQRRDALLDRRTGDQPPGHLGRQAALQLRPEGVVRPVFDGLSVSGTWM